MRKVSGALVASIGLLMGCSIAQAGSYFNDSFESNDLKTTSAEGFHWGDYNATSIVRETSLQNVLVNDGSTLMKVINDGRNWTAQVGSNSLRFRYPAGVSQAEQRFDMGTPHTDFWVRYWIRVPVNYKKPAANDKFFALWMDAYDTGQGATAYLGLWPDSTGNGANIAIDYCPGSGQIDVGYRNYTQFITYPTDQGRWMQLVWHVKAESKAGASDGQIQLWRRWSNESSMKSLIDTSGLPLKVAPTVAGFRYGYIMGWSNGTYAVDTEWLIDDFTLGDSGLLGVSGGKTPAAPSAVAAH